MKKILFVLPLMAMIFMACGNKIVSETELTNSDTIILDTVETDTVEVETTDTVIVLDKVF